MPAECERCVVVWLGYDTPELGDSPVPDAAGDRRTSPALVPGLGGEWWLAGPERGVVGVLNHSPDFVKRHLGWVDGEIAADTEDVKDFLQDVREEREIWKDTYDTASDWVGDRVDAEIAGDKKTLQDGEQALREEGEIWHDRYDKTKDWVDGHMPDLNPFD